MASFKQPCYYYNFFIFILFARSSGETFPWHISKTPLYIFHHHVHQCKEFPLSFLMLPHVHQIIFPLSASCGDVFHALLSPQTNPPPSSQLTPIYPCDSPATSLFLLLEPFLSESAEATLCGEYSPSRHPGTAPGSLSPPALSSSGPPLPPTAAAGATMGGQASGALARVSQGLNCHSALW